MGYDLHITRRADWSQEGNDITSQEWLDYINIDPELQLKTENGPLFATWSGKSALEEPWLDWSRGQIQTKNPDDALIDKMVSIAKRLHAVVQGDEGELYQSHLDAHRIPPDPHTTLKIIGLIVLFCICVFLGSFVFSEYLNLTTSVVIGIAFATIITLIWIFIWVTKRKLLRRPVKIQWAPSEQIRKYSDIEEDFSDRVLKDFVKAILYSSDDTRLKTYEPGDSEQARKQREKIIQRTLSIYGIDISGLYDGPLYKVFELIRDKQNRTSP